ncbi:hypothetical protein ACFQL4_23550 [Halosimplex aquaticum]
MADEALQRTVRRCAATVVIPLSVLVIQFHRYIRATVYEERLTPALTLLIPGGLLVGAIGYLVLSALQIDRPPSDDGQSGGRDEADGDSAAETA